MSTIMASPAVRWHDPQPTQASPPPQPVPIDTPGQPLELEPDTWVEVDTRQVMNQENPGPIRPMMEYVGPDGQAVPMGEQGMFGYLSGQAGVGKTSTLHALAAAALAPGLPLDLALNFRLAPGADRDTRPVLVVNLETTRADFVRGLDRIARLMGQHPDPAKRPPQHPDGRYMRPDDLVAYSLDAMPPDKAKAAVAYVIRKHNPRLVLFDGWADLVRNVNDPDETGELMVWAKTVCAPLTPDGKGRLMLGIVHDNEGPDKFGKARGHLGSDLQRQSRIALELKRDKATDEVTLGVRKASHGRAPKAAATLVYDEAGRYFRATGWGQDEHGLKPKPKAPKPSPKGGSQGVPKGGSQGGFPRGSQTQKGNHLRIIQNEAQRQGGWPTLSQVKELTGLSKSKCSEYRKEALTATFCQAHGLPIEPGNSGSQGVPKGGSQGVPKGGSQGVPKGGSQGVPKGVPKGGSPNPPPKGGDFGGNHRNPRNGTTGTTGTAGPTEPEAPTPQAP